ncbi:hypothetical protein [Vibrio harveyi]|uniref:hypothetical protein n=1 Tax=Vibrio harveyi group TaxID=717610 RepID=UPI00238023CF|nr:hypothetical protein [Vibrio harveyi]
MGALTGIIPIVRRKCPGVMDLMMLDALLDAYREFCIKSEYLLKSETITNAVAGTASTLPVDSNYVVLKVESVSPTDSNDSLSVNDDYSLTDSGEKITFKRDYSSVTVNYIVTPSAIADPLLLDVSDALINRYGDKIAAGAAAKLRAMPAQLWTEFGLSEMFERDFIEACREAFRDRRDSFNTFQNKTRKHRFY